MERDRYDSPLTADLREVGFSLGTCENIIFHNCVVVVENETVVYEISVGPSAPSSRRVRCAVLKTNVHVLGECCAPLAFPMRVVRRIWRAGILAEAIPNGKGAWRVVSLCGEGCGIHSDGIRCT